MAILLYHPSSVSEIETGIINTKSIYSLPHFIHKKDRLYVVCGGNNHQSSLAGEIVSDTIKAYFNSFLDSPKDISLQFIEKAVRMGEITLSEFQKENPETKGISTALSLFYLAPDCVYLCQIGESYICQIRNRQIIYKSVDNQADKLLRGVDKPVDVNTVCLKDIQTDDQFFICNHRISSYK